MAREILGDDIQEDNRLYNRGRYLYWTSSYDGNTATLDDAFTADELEAIAWWMRNMKVKDE